MHIIVLRIGTVKHHFSINPKNLIRIRVHRIEMNQCNEVYWLIVWILNIKHEITKEWMSQEARTRWCNIWLIVNAALSSTVLESATHYVFVVALSSLINDEENMTVTVCKLQNFTLRIFYFLWKFRENNFFSWKSFDFTTYFSVIERVNFRFFHTVLK